MKKDILFCLLALILCFASFTAFADTEYPVTVHLDEAGITLRLPEDALYVTQHSTKEDRFFQFVGEQFYDMVINDLVQNDMTLDAVSVNNTWQVRVYVIDDYNDISLIGMSEEYAQAYLNRLYGSCISSGMNLDDRLVVMNDNHAIIGIRERQNGRAGYTIITTISDNKAISIDIVDMYYGSITPEKLRQITIAIAEGILFE